MSLDVYLDRPRKNGLTEQEMAIECLRANGFDYIATRIEDLLNDPDREETRVFSYNITHNLGPMADVAGIYGYLWRPDEFDPPITKAGELIVPLEEGLKLLREQPARFTARNPENGWGSYDGLVKMVSAYLAACKEHPDANVSVSR